MKEKIVNYILILVTIMWILLSIIFAYQDLSSEIKDIKEKSNNEQFHKDNIIFKEEISRMQRKLDKIQSSTQIIADQLEIDIKEINYITE